MRCRFGLIYCVTVMIGAVVACGPDTLRGGENADAGSVDRTPRGPHTAYGSGGALGSRSIASPNIPFANLTLTDIDDLDDPGDLATSFYCGDGLRDPVKEECDNQEEQQAPFCTEVCQTTDAVIVGTTEPGTSRRLGFGRHPITGGPNGLAASYVERDEDGDPTIRVSLFDEQGHWLGSPDVSGSTLAVSFSHPVVAPLPDGSFAAVWTAFDTDGDELGIALRKVGPLATDVGSSQTVNITTDFSQYDADAVWNGSELVVAWVDNSAEQGGPDILYRTFNDGLFGTSGEQVLAATSAVEGNVALVAVNGSWAAAWRSNDGGAEETIFVRDIGSGTDWSVGPLMAGPETDRPALVSLDAEHLLLVFTEGTDPGDLGIANIARLRAVVLDLAAPGAVDPGDIQDIAALQPGHSSQSLEQRQPNAVRTGDTEGYIGWTSERLLSGAQGEDVWLKPVSWSGTGPVTLDLSAEELSAPRWDDGRTADQTTLALAVAPLPTGPELFMAWTDFALSSLAGPPKGEPEVMGQLASLPLLRGDTLINTTCSVTVPCAEGEGDCNADDECEPGLECGQSNGPQFGWGRAFGVCVDPSCLNNQLDAGEEEIDCGGDCGACIDCPLGYSFGFCLDDPDLVLWMRSDDPGVSIVAGTEQALRKVVSYPNRAAPGGIIETVGADRNPRQTGYNVAPSTLFDENSRFSSSLSPSTFDFLHTADEATIAIAFKTPRLPTTPEGQTLLSTSTANGSTALGLNVAVGPGGELDVTAGSGSQVALQRAVPGAFSVQEEQVLILRKSPYADPAYAVLDARVNGAWAFEGHVSQQVMGTGSTPRQLTVGGQDSSSTGGERFRGWVSEVIIYDRALTETEMQALEERLMDRWACVPSICTLACPCGPPGEVCETDGNCNADDQCFESYCLADQCTLDVTPTGAPCDDDNLCTVDDACHLGACGGNLRDCSEIDQGCQQGVCNPADGQCVLQNRVNGYDCDDQDGAACTVGSCSNGVCQPDPSKTINEGECATCGSGMLSPVAAVASTELGGNVAARAVDFNTGTRWESVHASDPQWVYVDLGADYHISSVVIDWETASAQDYTISVAPDGTSAGTLATQGAHWTTLATVYDPAHVQHRVKTHAVNGVGRYVRMHGTTRTGMYGYSIWEFAVMGDANSECGSICSPPCGACATCSGGACVTKPAGTLCRAMTGGCDAEETCNGSSQACPVDAFVVAGTVCRAAVVGGCDIAEACSGSTSNCPADAIATAGTVCTDDGDACTLDICDGASASCPRTQQCVSDCTGQPDYTPFTSDSTSCTADVCIGGVGRHVDNGTCACTCAPATITVDSFNSASDYGTASTSAGTTTGITTPGGYALNKVIATGLTTHTADGQDVFVTAPASASNNIKIHMGLASTLSNGSMAGYTTLRIRAAGYGTDNVGSRNGFEVSLGDGGTTLGTSSNWYSQTMNNVSATSAWSGHSKSDLIDIDLPLNSTTFPGLGSLSAIKQVRITLTGGGATRNWRIDNIELRDGAACSYPGGQSCGCAVASDCHDGNLCTTDACTGTAPFKTCSYTNLPAGTVCRASAGSCDVAETCAGGGAQCPGNVLLVAGTICRTATGACDVTEVCDGVGSGCPSDVLMAGGTLCRPSAGACDVAETCSGSSGACPADALVASGTSCRAAVGSCDVAETCSGSAASCPADALRASGYVCRTATGACDAAETCSGASGICPADALLPSGTVCRAAVAGGCDIAETCNGSVNTCPSDAVAPSGSACTDDGNACTHDVCNGSATCPRTPEPSCSACGNSTLTRSAAVASSVTGSNVVAYAIDGSTSTRWESAQGSDPQWIYVDLGATRHVSSVVLNWETASAKNYTIQVAPDGTCAGTGSGCLSTNTPWTTLYTSPTYTTNPDHRIDTVTVSGVGRYVRMYGTVRMTQYGYALWDFAVKGDTNTVCGTTCTPACGACGTCSDLACVPKAAGAVCRAASGACDTAETCNGSAQTCPTDVLLSAGTVCRAAVAGGCDIAETCSGSSGACPVDAVVASGVVCRAAVGSCDVAETCNGVAATCPNNAVLAIGAVCRASAGSCDVAETCNGVSGNCPSDVLIAAGTSCRASAGACDVAETCSGSSGACPADSLRPGGYVCRAAVAGGCDIAETCNGSSSSCPADVIATAGTACTDDGDACTLDICDGASASCPRTQQCVSDCTGQPDYTPFTSDATSCTADVCIGGVGRHVDNGTCACTCAPTTVTVDNFNSASDYGTASTSAGTTTGITTPGSYVLNKVIATGLTTHTADGQDVFVTAPASASNNIKIHMGLASTLSNGSMAGYTTLRIRAAGYGTDNVGSRNGFEVSLGDGGTTLGTSSNWYSQTMNNVSATSAWSGHSKSDLIDIDLPLNSTTFPGLGSLSAIKQVRITLTGGGATRNWRIDDVELRGGAGGNCQYPDGAGCGCSAASDCNDGNACTSDACTGTSPNKVCAYTNLSAGTVCRAAVGSCDAAETCAGGGAQCPADVKRANGFVCRSAVAGGCDVQEVCDGVSNACPADVVQTAGTICRAAAGACDVTETCNGSSNACPADVKVAGGTVCRPSAGVCDVAETCSGSAAACPADVFVATGTSCRAASGSCDVAETCSGSAAACPADALRASGYVCRTATGACDAAETCSGASSVCPADALLASGTVCRAAAAGGCDIAETCNGSVNTCPSDVVAPSGSACTDDGNACTHDICDGTATCPRTPEPSCSACGNNTLTRSAAVASTVNASNSAANAIDGSTSTRWESAQGNDPQWIYVDLGATRHVSSVVLDWETASAKNYTVQIAPDGTCAGTSSGCLSTNTPWTTLYTSPTYSTNPDHRIDTVTVSGVGRYVRMYGTVRMTQYGYSLWDFAVKGDTNTVCGTTCTPACGACATCSDFACVPKAAGTVCRAASGACDAAETCNGSAQTCPADVLLTAGTVCRAAVAGGCDIAETCSGSSAACPIDAVVTSGVVCRAAVGSCDVAETCNGVAATCPSNAVLAIGAVCRASAGSCDVAETCNGVSGSCPSDVLIAAGTSCRASAGACDVAESCSGSAATCPVDGLVASGTVCRAAAAACDAAETCSGSASACPADQLLPSGTVCRAAVAGGCDFAETCDGTVNTCPADMVATSGSACTNDGDSCTQDICNGTATCPRTLEPWCQPCGNSALTRSAAVASSELGGNTASKALDSNTGTRWESVHGSDPQWVYLDLGEDRHISSLSLDWETASAKNYTIQVAPNGTCTGTGSGCLGTNTPWTTIYTSPTHTTNPNHRIDNLTVSGVGRYVRMYGTTRMIQYGYSLWEFWVNGDTNAACVAP